MTSPFPAGIPLVQVTGAEYGADAQPRAGRVTFTLQQQLTDPADAVVISPYAVSAVLGTTWVTIQNGIPLPGPGVNPGCFSVVLIATDYAALIPDTPPWYYRVTFDLDGSDPYNRDYLIPHSAVPVDLSQLAAYTAGFG